MHIVSFVRGTQDFNKSGKTFGEVMEHFIIGVDEYCFVTSANSDCRVIGSVGKAKNCVKNTKPHTHGPTPSVRVILIQEQECPSKNGVRKYQLIFLPVKPSKRKRT